MGSGVAMLGQSVGLEVKIRKGGFGAGEEGRLWDWDSVTGLLKHLKDWAVFETPGNSKSL